MKSNTSFLPRQFSKLCLTVSASTLLGLAGLLFATTVSAVEIIATTDCAGATNPNLSCSSNDIKINDVSQMDLNEGGSGSQAPVIECDEGSTGTVDIKLTTQLNATGRYDVISWFGRNGNDPRSADVGGCYVSSLPDSPDVGFILDLEAGADACLDVNSSANPVEQYYLQIPFTCVDNKSIVIGNGGKIDIVDIPDGEVDVFALITWFQNPDSLICGTGGGELMIPGLNSKCDISLLTGLDIVITPTPLLSVVKSSTTVSVNAPGTVNYSYLVTNEGDVALTGISLSDDNDDGDMSCGSVNLAIGADMTCTASHAVSQDEINDNGSPTPASGTISNTVTASSNEAADAMDSLDIPIVLGPEITVEKSSTTAQVSTTGSVAYSYEVTNTGNVALTGISLSDDNDEGDMSCPGAALAVGASMTCSATHTVTQGEIDVKGSPVADSGELANTVTASADGEVEDTDSLTIPMAYAPSMMLDKSSATTSISAPGTVTYDYTITNDGNVTLTGIALLDDNDEDDASCPSDTLVPGASMDCTATHLVTQGEIDINGSPVADSGMLSNTATASSTEADNAGDSLDIPIVQSPGMTVAKSSTTSVITAAGTVSYSYTVTNTGNTTLTGISLSDDNDDNDLSCPETSLDVGDGMICTASRAVSQQELEAGGTLDNEVTADSNETSPVTDDLSIPVRPPLDDVPIPASSFWTLMLLILSVMGMGLYFRRERSRQI